jgi:hypothetical protein
MGKITETLAKGQKQQSNHKRPPRIYFHAFTVPQLIKALEKSTNKKKSNATVYF